MVTIQEGKGLAEDLIKIAGPLIVQQAQAGLQDIQRGQSLADTWSNRVEQLTRGFKRKAPALAWTSGNTKPNAPQKTPIKELPNRYGISLDCKSMVSIEGFLKTQDRILRHRARGRFISPYQIGGTIFGKSTMTRYPLMHTFSRLLDPHSMMMRQRRKMKGGTISGKSERMRYPWMYPSASRENAKWLMTMARRQNAIKRKRRLTLLTFRHQHHVAQFV